MKTYKIILFLIISLFISGAKGQSSLIKPFLKKGTKEITNNAIEYSLKKGAKEVTNETIEYSVKRGAKELTSETIEYSAKKGVKFSTTKSPKELLKLVELNSKNGITKSLALIRVETKGTASSSKLLRQSTKEIEKAVIRTDINEYGAKQGYNIVANKKSISFFNKEGVELGRIYQSGGKRVIVAPNVIPNNSSKLKYLVNPILDNPLPNSIYKIGNGTYFTDKYSRTILAKISSFPKTVVNRNGIKKGGFKRSLNGGKIGDHDGHLIGHSLGGNYGSVNLVAQHGNLNTSKYAAVENFLRNNRGLIKNYQVKPTYLGQAKRPDKIGQLFEFRGDLDKLKAFKKSNPSLKYAKKVDVNGQEVYDCIITHSNQWELKPFNVNY